MTVMTDTVSITHRRTKRRLHALRALPFAVIGWVTSGAHIAEAQYFEPPPFHDERYAPRPYPGILPRAQIMRQLRQEGFRPTTGPMLNRDVYVLDAIDPDGFAVRVIVGAFDGEIVQVFVNRRPARVLVDPDDDLSPVDRPAPRAAPSRPAPPPPVARLPERKAEPKTPEAQKPPQPRDPALTPANPTIIRRSPLAIPKESGPPAPPAPQTGSRTAPRVIPLAPEVKAPVTTPVPALPADPAPPQAAAPAPPPPSPIADPKPAPTVQLPALPPEPAAPDLAAPSGLPAAPPAAVLDFRAKDRPRPEDKPAGTQ